MIPNTEVKEMLKRKDNQFLRLLRNTRAHLSRTYRTPQELDDFKVAISFIPAMRHDPIFVLSPSDRREIQNATSFAQIFVVLNQYWNSVHYELLEYVIKEYGNASLKKEMRAYVQDFDELEAQIGIDHFNTIKLCSPRPDSVAFNIDLVGIEHTRHDARIVQRSTADHFGMHSHTPRILQSIVGYTKLTLLVPYEVARYVMYTFHQRLIAVNLLSRPLEERVVFKAKAELSVTLV